MARDYYSGDDYVGISFLLVEVQLVASDALLWVCNSARVPNRLVLRTFFFFCHTVIPSQQSMHLGPFGPLQDNALSYKIDFACPGSNWQTEKLVAIEHSSTIDFICDISA